MNTIEANLIPDLEGNDVLSAKKFFKVLGDMGVTFHADDPADDTVNLDTGALVFSADAARKVNAVMEKLRDAVNDWEDPDFLYSLAGEGSFKLEEDYPGFIIDRTIPGADRTGYVSVPGQNLPTVVIEDSGKFVAIQIEPAVGRLTEATRFRIVPTTGGKFGNGGIDVSNIVLDFENYRATDAIGFVEDVVVEMIADIQGPRF